MECFFIKLILIIEFKETVNVTKISVLSPKYCENDAG